MSGTICDRCSEKVVGKPYKIHLRKALELEESFGFEKILLKAGLDKEKLPEHLIYCKNCWNEYPYKEFWKVN